ncbi:MAG: BTAD domain-containing putative transcriptional regulator, partial [Chloroflexota bacterium]
MSNTLTLRIFALGHARVYRGERELTMRDWTYSKSKELLLFLAAHPPRTKGEIGEALWPDATAAQLSSNFRVVVLYLRHALGGREWIPFADERYTFNRTLPYEFDVERFDERVKEALRVKATAPARATALLQEAIQLYQGDFCADLPDGTWHMARQAELSRRYLDALLVLAQLHLAERRFAPAVEAYRAAIAKDNYREAAHRGLMRCLAQMGERAQAIQHYHALVNMLRDELRQTPEPETTALFERLQRGDESALTPFQAPPRHTRFVGRERELAELRAEFTQAAANIVGLIGMGGIGKTTLATQLAHALRAQFPDGVLWAHVATSEPMAILDSWARAFQCDYSGLPDLDSRAAAMRSLLADKHALLILDDVWDAERARPL